MTRGVKFDPVFDYGQFISMPGSGIGQSGRNEEWDIFKYRNKEFYKDLNFQYTENSCSNKGYTVPRQQKDGSWINEGLPCNRAGNDPLGGSWIKTIPHFSLLNETAAIFLKWLQSKLVDINDAVAMKAYMQEWVQSHEPKADNTYNNENDSHKVGSVRKTSAYTSEQIIEALEGKNHVDLSNGPRIHTSDAVLIADMLVTNKALQTLNLRNANIMGEGTAAILKALEQNDVLTTLDLSYNHAPYCALNVLKYNKILTTLKLSSMVGQIGIDGPAGSLKENSGLKNLDLSNNSISRESIEQLIEVLKVNTSLKNLNLRKSIWPQGVKMMVQYLKFHPTALQTLDLSENSYMLTKNNKHVVIEAVKYCKEHNTCPDLVKVDIMMYHDEDEQIMQHEIDLALSANHHDAKVFMDSTM